MNDEPSSSAAAASPFSPSSPLGPQSANDEAGPSTSSAVTGAAEAARDRKQQNRLLFNRKRGELLDDLLRNLDLIIYAELSTIYHLDCFFFRFLVRALVQLIFLTPKPAVLPEPPGNRPFIGAIFGSNLMCIILHMVSDAPSAGEATRGYLHGGLAMDFIGQKGPTSKLYLVLLDLLVLGLQIAHLAAYVLKQRLREGTVLAAVSRLNRLPHITSVGQNLDDEERGVRHSVEIQQRDDIEMQDLNPPSEAASGGPATATAESSGTTLQTPSDRRPEEREALLPASDSMNTAESGEPPSRSDAHIFDAFNSGQIVLADLNLPRTVSEQYWMYQKVAEEMPNDGDTSRILRERLAGRVMRWRFDNRSATERLV